MTALCPGGGSSSPKTGAAAVTTYSAGLLADLLVTVGSPWLIPVIPLLGLAPLVLASFCATDPPAMPVFTSAETNAILNLTFGANFDSGLTKAAAVVLNAIWGQSCKCDVGTAAVPSPPAIPAGTPIFQAPTPNAAQPCDARTITPTNLTFGNSLYRYEQLNPGYNITAFSVNIVQSVFSAPGCSVQWTISWFALASSVTPTRTDTFTLTPTQTYNFAFTAPPNTTAVEISCLGLGLSGITNIADSYQLWCNGTLPGSVQSPCCPPDASTQAYLDIIVKQLTLVQRQLAPFAYIHGTAHAGLSGIGQFSVSGLLGLAVAVTTLPARAGATAGDPITIYDAGWVNVGTADGWSPRQFITSNPTIIKPVSGDVTLVGYSIPADVVMTITELVREP